MPIRITVMTRFEKDGQQIGTILFTDILYFLSHIGDVIQLRNKPSYEVLMVIIRNTDIVLEVKEYTNSEKPLVTNI